MSHDPELLGALDIVEAFTALRHELKLQVRAGRTLQQEFAESLERIEQTVATAVTAQSRPSEKGDASTEELRTLAEVVAELEESLQRAVAAMAVQSPSGSAKTEQAAPFNQVEQLLDAAPWIVRTFAGQFVDRVRATCQEGRTGIGQLGEKQADLLQGLELLLERVRRQMRQCGIERLDVLHKPFDAAAMQAIEVVDDAQVPSGHVADQLRPAYRRHGKIFRYAEVRIAR